MSQLTKNTFKAQAPSNIAFIKYWGKKNIQEPINPSLSMTLKNSKTITSWEIIPSDKYELEIYLDDVKKDSFKSKIEKWFDYLGSDFDFLKRSKSIIRTHNTFPHSTGIASSASAFASLSLCLTQIHSHVNGKELEAEQISELARLGSGSASRSIEGPFCEWGGTSDKFATPLKNVHESFMNLRDAICIVSNEKKSVSSTIGHGLMDNHIFQSSRVKQANLNLNLLNSAIENGDVWKFGEILEEEALTLHSLMMTSSPSFILLEPNTLAIIKHLRKFRNDYNIPLFFTLDAGPNVHLIYLSKDQQKVESFIENDLKSYIPYGVIYDEVGLGASILYE
jgi:diphosphomevalonate decarboxylase